jgi:hypothetical protein
MIRIGSAARSLAAALGALGAAVFLALFLSNSRPHGFALFATLALIWTWALVLSAACVTAGHALLARLVPASERSRFESLAISFPLGVVILVLGIYVGGFLHLLSAPFAVILPALMIAAGIPAARRAWSRLRRDGFPGRVLQVGWLSAVAWVVGILLLGVLYLGVLSPAAVNYDAAWIHLSIAQDYARAGHIVPFPGNWEADVMHLGSVLNTWSFLVPGLSMPALHWMMALHTEFTAFVWTLVGVAAAIGWLSRRRVSGAWVFFFLFPGLFVYDSNMGGAADHFLALFTPALLLATAKVTRRFAPGACVLWGLLAGAAMMTKAQSVYAVGPIGLWILGSAGLGLWRRRRRGVDAPSLQTVARGLGVMAAAAFFVLLPHLASNLVFFRNPLYPLMQGIFTGSRPTVKDATVMMQAGFPDWHNLPPAALGARLSEALQLVATFSFVPHYSYVQGLPVFGSLFTLAIPLVALVGRARRLWIGCLVALGATFAWALTYWVDRNLQTFLPLLVAATGAACIRLWELGWAARAGLTALLGVQLIWSGGLYFAHSELSADRIGDSIALLRTAMQGKAAEKLKTYRSEFVELGRSLPENAKVLLHDSHGNLGIDRPVYLDWPGYQGVIDYREFRSPADLVRRLHELGITYVVHTPGAHPSDSKQEEVIFDAFAERYGRVPRVYGGLMMFPVPREPGTDHPYKVVAIGLGPAYPDGLYPVENLSTVETLPPQYLTWKGPSRTAPSPAALLPEADAVIIGSNAALDGPTTQALTTSFHNVRGYGGFRLMLR